MSFKIDLRWWGPSKGCISSSTLMKELWVRLVGLPAQIQILERLGGVCSGFIAVNKLASGGSSLKI